jgi:hypothetical protein
MAVTTTIPSTREYWAGQVREHRDAEGRIFRYVPVRHPGARGLVVHFSAFFGEWGDAPQHRKIFQGHFHRLRMLGDAPDYDFLFVCDEFGADGNGTYYTGEGGDLFVERAMLDLIRGQIEESGHGAGRTVTMGSSMGATGALKFGLMLGVKGIVAISPHIDLDVCAERQGRMRHVAAIVADGDPMAPHNWEITRQVRLLVERWQPPPPPPRLFVQACRDDAGVYHEQVEPLCVDWARAGGSVTLDARRTGGHTSDHATRPLLLDAVGRILGDQEIDVVSYQRDRAFRGITQTETTRRTLRRVGGRVLRAVKLR